MIDKSLNIFFVVFCFIFISIHFTKKINLVTADLGRHIKNGETFVESKQIVKTNYYSYTQKDHFTVNHHWGSGVVFYLVYKYCGFQGLSILNIVLGFCAFLIFFIIALRKAQLPYVIIASFLTIPLIVSRTEIRPEMISFCLMGLFYFLLVKSQDTKFCYLKIISLCSFQIIWVNSHILFIAGPIIVGTFLLDNLINKKKDSSKLVFLLFLLCALSLLNPFGVTGLLAPFNIFKEYGYAIAENQSAIFMLKRFPNDFLYPFFIIVFLIGAFSFYHLVSKREIRSYIKEIIFFSGWGFLSWMFIRGFPIFAFFAIGIISRNFSILRPLKGKLFKSFVYITISIIFIIFICIQNHRFNPFRGNIGFGTIKQLDASIDFFKKNNLKGPIFNNYDIGGFLIYSLFPQEKVFVDNRPEAYTSEFLKDKYVLMQESENTWEEMVVKYNLNIIFFYRHDMTPWAQPFLIRRLQDSKWIPVFVDYVSIILVKSNDLNKKIIEKFKIPDKYFSIGR